jgi:hypothetical protein
MREKLYHAQKRLHQRWRQSFRLLGRVRGLQENRHLWWNAERKDLDEHLQEIIVSRRGLPMKKPILLAIAANLASLSFGAPAFATSCTAHSMLASTMKPAWASKRRRDVPRH